MIRSVAIRALAPALVLGIAFPIDAAPARNDSPQAASAPAAAPAPEGYPSQGPAHFAAGMSPEIEVKRANTGHLLVRPKVNGHEAGWFIFDTGAGICVIAQKRDAAITLKDSGKLDTVGVGATSATLLRAESVELGPLTLEDVPMIELDLSFLKEHLGDEISGVIGYGLLSRCVAEIDLAAPSIALHDPAKFEPSRSKWTPAELDKFIPVVPAKFEGHDGLFTLDTGANDAVSFHVDAVDQLDLLHDRPTTDAKLGGVGGFIRKKRGRVETFELGGIQEENLDATFEIEAKKGPDPRIAGNIGVGLLKRAVLTTDYGHDRVAFVPRPGDEEGN